VPEGHPVKEVLHERLSGPSEAVAPDGGRTGDVRDRLVVDENAESKDELEPARGVPSPKPWTSFSFRKVAATRYSPRPATGTKSTSSMNRVPVPTGSSAHPKAAASTCVASIARSNEDACPAQTAPFHLSCSWTVQFSWTEYSTLSSL
jgi:hypothetical protein